jgi:hypothetical protein
VKKRSSKIIAIFCLFIYLLFGFLNSGNVGFCLGDEHGSHFGMIFMGYETCCHDRVPLVTSNQNQATFNCECNDVDIEPVIVSQAPFSISEIMHNIESVLVSSVQQFSHNAICLKISKNQSIYYQKAPPDLLSKNSEIIKNSIVLLI